VLQQDPPAITLDQGPTAVRATAGTMGRGPPARQSITALLGTIPAQLLGRPAPSLALEPTLATVTLGTAVMGRRAHSSTTALESEGESIIVPQQGPLVHPLVPEHSVAPVILGTLETAMFARVFSQSPSPSLHNGISMTPFITAINNCTNGVNNCAPTGSTCTYTGPGTYTCACITNYTGSGTICNRMIHFPSNVAILWRMNPLISWSQSMQPSTIAPIKSTTVPRLDPPAPTLVRGLTAAHAILISTAMDTPALVYFPTICLLLLLTVFLLFDDA